MVITLLRNVSALPCFEQSTVTRMHAFVVPLCFGVLDCLLLITSLTLALHQCDFVVPGDGGKWGFRLVVCWLKQ